jgi:ribosomal protein S18 acetylase RimI-like enzyme
MHQIKQITAEDTYPIRHPVLRKGRPVEDCVFEADNDKNTFHLGLFYNSKLVGVASFMKNKSTLISEENQYQLRGMAILKDYQNKGLGNLLLRKGEEILLQKNIDSLWFNARELAVSFYKKNNFQVIGDSFLISNIGLHYVMYKKIT